MEADDLTTQQRLEHEVVMLAHAVLRYGPVYTALLERAEQELVAFRQHHECPIIKAQRLLRTYARKGDLRTIR